MRAFRACLGRGLDPRRRSAAWRSAHASLPPLRVVPVPSVASRQESFRRRLARGRYVISTFISAPVVEFGCQYRENASVSQLQNKRCAAPHTLRASNGAPSRGDCSLTGCTPRASVDAWAFRSTRAQALSRGTASMIGGASNRVHRSPRSRIWAAAFFSPLLHLQPLALRDRPALHPQLFRLERRSIRTNRWRARPPGARFPPSQGGEHDEGTDRRGSRKRQL